VRALTSKWKETKHASESKVGDGSKGGRSCTRSCGRRAQSLKAGRRLKDPQYAMYMVRGVELDGTMEGDTAAGYKVSESRCDEELLANGVGWGDP